MSKRKFGKAPTLAQQNIYESQIEKLQHQYKRIWSKMSFVEEATKAFLSAEREISEMRKIDLINLDPLESFVFFYCDGTAQIVLTVLARGSAEQEELIRDSSLTDSPLPIESGKIGRVFYQEGLRLPEKPVSYREVMQILNEYFRYMKTKKNKS